MDGLSSRPWDVAIAGGGPAAAAAAIVCARGGLRTLIVARPWRDGAVRPLESLNPRVRECLAALGAAHAIDHASHAAFEDIWIDGVARPVAGAGKRPRGYHVDRALFDEALLGAAIEGGARHVTGSVAAIRDGGRTLICADGRRFESEWAVDATGRSRRLARLAGLGRQILSPELIAWTGIAAARAGDAEDDRTVFDSGRDFWIWRTSRTRSGRTWTALCGKGAQVAELEALRAGSLAGSVKRRRVDWELATALVRERTILAGDAGGSLDPATGQGILNALMSGMAAAATVRACLDDPAAEPLHAAAYDDWFASGLRGGARELAALYRHRGIGCLDVGSAPAAGTAARPSGSDGVIRGEEPWQRATTSANIWK